MPVLHPVMTGGQGQVHSVQWHIADPESGYVNPAKTLAMMAIDLLSDEAARASHILEQFQPFLSKEGYLNQQQDVFRTESFDGAALTA